MNHMEIQSVKSFLTFLKGGKLWGYLLIAFGIGAVLAHLVDSVWLRFQWRLNVAAVVVGVLSLLVISGQTPQVPLPSQRGQRSFTLSAIVASPFATASGSVSSTSWPPGISTVVLSPKRVAMPFQASWGSEWSSVASSTNFGASTAANDDASIFWV